MLDATRFANAAAAVAVTRHGAQASAPTCKEIDQMLFSGKSDRIVFADGISRNGHAEKPALQSTLSSETYAK